MPHLEVFCGIDAAWRVRIVGANGERLFVSESYASKSNARRAAKRAAVLTGWEVIEK